MPILRPKYRPSAQVRHMRSLQSLLDPSMLSFGLPPASPMQPCSASWSKKYRPTFVSSNLAQMQEPVGLFFCKHRVASLFSCFVQLTAPKAYRLARPTTPSMALPVWFFFHSHAQAHLVTAHFVRLHRSSSPRQQVEVHFFPCCMPTCMAESMAPFPHAKAMDVPSGSVTFLSAPAPNESTLAHAPTCSLCSMGAPMLLHATMSNFHISTC